MYIFDSNTDTFNMVNNAIAYATEKHSGTYRKGRMIPYIFHPLEAANITATLTSDPEVIAASVLHDTIEDTDATYDDILDKFGQRVADYVMSETEDKMRGLPAEQSWKARKQATIDHLKNETDINVKILVLSDKLSNLRQLYIDYNEVGEELWQRFHQHDPWQHKWYYTELCDCFKELSCFPAYDEYCWRLSMVFGRYK